jgi:hypothetical protein
MLNHSLFFTWGDYDPADIAGPDLLFCLPGQGEKY